MADNIQTNQSAAQPSFIPTGGGKPRRLSLPEGEAEVGGREVIATGLFISNKSAFPKTEIGLEAGENIEIRGKGLEPYNRIGFALEQNGPTVDVAWLDLTSSDKSAKFKMPSLADKVKDGGSFWLKLLAVKSDQPPVPLDPHGVYFLQQPENEKNSKNPDFVPEGRAAAARMAQLNSAVNSVVNGTLSGIASAVAGSGGGTILASPVGAKSVIQSTAGSANSAAKVTSTNENLDYDEDQQAEITESARQGAISSTLEASTAGTQTISQGSTVTGENSSQISASGTSETTGGGSGTISQTGTVTGNSTGQIQGGATINSQSSVQASASESVSSQTQSSVENQTNISGTASSEAALNTKTSAAAPTQTSAPGSAKSTISQSSTTAASGAISSGGTAALGGGVYFGGGTTAGGGQINPQPQQPQAQPPAKSPLGDQQQASASVNQQAKIKQSSGEDSSAAQKPAPQQSPAKPKQPQAPLSGKGSVDGVNAGDSKQEKSLELNQSLVATASNSGTLPPKIPASEQPLPKAPKGMEGILGKLAGSNAQIGKILSAKNGNDEVIPRSNPLGGSTLGSAPEQPSNARESSPSARDSSSEKAHKDPSLGAPGAKGQLPQKSKDQEPLPGQQPKENAPGEDEDRNKQEGSEDEDSDQEPETLVDEFARKNIPQKTSGNVKVDNAEIERLTKETNRLLNSFLLEQSAVIWAAAIPSLGLSILLGMVLGDFIWLAKGYIVRGILNRLLTTEQLKKRADEIASQIKISGSVKIHIFLFNVVAIVFPVMAILLILATGCNYPVSGKQPVVGYRLSAIGAIIGDSCQPFDFSRILTNAVSSATSQTSAQTGSSVTPRGN